jgi:REP element-mobilizing transposase RayT
MLGAMARKPRVELEGGLYHLITRGNDRQIIFHEPADYSKFLSILKIQKTRLPFFLYAYCLMPNHVHLLIERKEHAVGRIMHRVLTSYSRYYNWKYGRVGHALQGRYKAILCQSDTYLCRLVRYIHLNPVRAKMVSQPEDYPYSSHGAYLGREQIVPVDIDPVLRHFGTTLTIARQHYRQFMRGETGCDQVETFSPEIDGRFLGTEEFVDATIHRLGETRPARPRVQSGAASRLDTEGLIATVEAVFQISREDFVGARKVASAVMAKEALIIVGRDAGASMRALAAISGIGISTISRRYEVAKRKLQHDGEFNNRVDRIRELYLKSELQNFRPDPKL